MSHRRVALLAALTLAASGCAGLVEVERRAAVELPPPPQTSAIVAADGSVLASLHAEQDREVVALDAIPRSLRDAVVAVEDARFWDHPGVDARAIARALWTNLREGRVAEGGSTITQQLAKNTVVGSAQTLERKLAEASIALQLEAELTKEQILERYLNTVYFGAGAYGAQTAADRYFGVDVAELTLAQAALLAGLLQAPARYDPWDHPEAALARRNLVLGRMANQGLITADDRDVARAVALEVAPRPEGDAWAAPYFVDHVLDALQHDPRFEVLGEDPAERAATLFGGGLVVETTLDPAWQAAAEDAVAAVLTEQDGPHAALVALDPASGSIRALVGGRDWDDEADPVARFNLATDARRQPGSAFKPLVLAAALGQGITLDDVFPGGATVSLPVAGAGTWTVSNADGRDLGAITLAQATAYSVNVVYARLIAEVGAQAVVDAAHAAGITSALAPYLSLALGAQEVSPLELATVQATFAASGVRREPTAVLRIRDAEGQVLWERPDATGTQAFDAEVAWQVTQALEGVVRRGTGQRAALARPVAGKTGTSQDSADAWFAGYTPELAAAVWVGYPEGRVPMVPPRTEVAVEGGTWPADVFARFASAALAGVEPTPFPLPASRVVTVDVDVLRGCLPNRYTPRAAIESRAFAAGTAPTEVCTEPASPPLVDVPDVRGMPVDAARDRLEDAGFTVQERPRFSTAVPPGQALVQDPPAGSARLLESGWLATIWVSSADRTPATVPDVLGSELLAAIGVLEGAGFAVEVVSACPDGSPACTGTSERPGTVWEQVPDAGARIPVHSVVRLSAYPPE